MMRLQPYNFKVIYKKGSLNESDYMSRHPVSGQHEISDEGEIAEAYANFIVNHAVPKSMTLNEIQEDTIKDPTLTKVRESLISGKWDNKDKDIFNRSLSVLMNLQSINLKILFYKGHELLFPKHYKTQLQNWHTSDIKGLKRQRAYLGRK